MALCNPYRPRINLRAKTGHKSVLLLGVCKHCFSYSSFQNPVVSIQSKIPLYTVMEGQILKLRLQYFGHLMRRLPGKDLDVGKM